MIVRSTQYESHVVYASNDTLSQDKLAI